MGAKTNRISKMRMADCSPEKAGVGGSIPSLATIRSAVYRHAVKSCSQVTSLSNVTRQNDHLVRRQIYPMPQSRATQTTNNTPLSRSP